MIGLILEDAHRFVAADAQPGALQAGPARFAQRQHGMARLVDIGLDARIISWLVMAPDCISLH